MKCPNPKCGSENPDGVAFCEQCGWELLQAGMAPPPGSAPQPTPAGPSARLLTATGAEIVLPAKPEINLGRPSSGVTPDVDLTSFDPQSATSRKHCRILETGGLYAIADGWAGGSASTNGTFVNDTQVQAGVQHPLNDGDRISFGPPARAESVKVTFRLS